jgi:hypothetical protein
MITRESQNSYSIRTIGGDIDIPSLTGAELRERLLAIRINDKPIWTDELVDGVVAMDIGESTPRPHGGWVS